MRKYAKRSFRRPIRRPRRKIAYKSRKPFLKRKGGFRKKPSMNVIRVKNDGINATFSKTNTGMTKFKYAMRKKFWTGAKNIYKQIVPVTLRLANNAVNGARQQYNWFYLFDQPGMYQTLGGAVIVTPATVNTGVAETLQPNNGVGYAQNTERIFWNKCICEYTMNNVSTTPVFVDIYRFKLKRDTSVNIDSAWEFGLEDEEADSSIVTNNATNWGTSPLDSVKLTTYYKCVNITHNVLQPGQLHVHKHDIHLSMPVNNELLNQTEGSSKYYKGMTEVDLFIVRGAPITATNSQATPTAAPVDVPIIANLTYEYKYIQDANVTYSYSSGLAQNNTATQQFNPGSGAINSSSVGGV